MLAVLLVSCERKSGEAELTISPLWASSLEEKKAEIIFDGILHPNETRQLPDVTGSGSIGYYMDEQFSLNTAKGFVRFYGTDGSEGGSASGGEFFRNDGVITASYKIVNEGKMPRRVLVYTTKSEVIVESN